VHWYVIGAILLFSVPVALSVLLTVLHFYLRWKYLHVIVRIFQEKPLFFVAPGSPQPDAEEVTLHTPDGLRLRGCYLHTPQPRKGVILFGLEFGSQRWSCVPYCEQLVAAGYDVFTFEPRNQGASDKDPHYTPLQWVTDRDLIDFRTALDYLESRADADPRGVGFFGISKGGSAGLLLATRDQRIRCCVTDGAFGTITTVIPFMRKWIGIYNSSYFVHNLLPDWYYGLLGWAGIHQVARERGVRFLSLESAIARLAPRPLLMIHGGADTYIRPQMAEALLARAGEPKSLWIVPGAKHNQALHVAGEEYHRRVCEFFDLYLCPASPPVMSPSAAMPASEPHDTPAEVISLLALSGLQHR
jgi:pimeloyl-ACP methyl ester carboxylesterase